MSTPTPFPSSAVEVERLTFSYPARSDSEDGRLYENFSLKVSLGSILALMGPSGSGSLGLESRGTSTTR